MLLVPLALEAAALELPLVGQHRVAAVTGREAAEALNARARIVERIGLGLRPLGRGELRGVGERGVGAADMGKGEGTVQQRGLQVCGGWAEEAGCVAIVGRQR